MPPSDLRPRVREKLQAFLDAPRSNPALLPRDILMLAEQEGIPVRASLLYLLTRLEMSEKEAARHWGGVGRHRDLLTRELGRDVGWRVASLDYFLNREPSFQEPTLIEGSRLERAENTAIKDGLTGLFTSRHFLRALQREIRRSQRHGLDLALMQLDPDGLGAINDRVGRRTGDLVLREAAAVIGGKIRDIDVAARYRGSKYLLMLPRTRRAGAFVVAERIRTSLEERFRQPLVDRERLGVTASGGVAVFPEDATSPEGLLSASRLALCRAKEAGKNQIVAYYDERRKGFRFRPLVHRLKVRTLRAGATVPQDAKLLNLSPSGVLLATPEPLPVGEKMSLSISEDREPSPVVSLRGSVVRTEDPGQEDSGAPHRAGVAFEPDPARSQGVLKDFLAGLRRQGVE